MKRANDYYKERGLMSPDEYYNKVEELLSNGKAKEYNDFIHEVYRVLNYGNVYYGVYLKYIERQILNRCYKAVC